MFVILILSFLVRSVELPPLSGTATFRTSINIRTDTSLNAEIVGTYGQGQSANYEGIYRDYDDPDRIWISYIAYSGSRRYICVLNPDGTIYADIVGSSGQKWPSSTSGGKHSVSENGVNLVAQFEGFRSSAYQDQGGVWTIGYGHTSGVKSGDTITEARAKELLLSDLQIAANAVNSYSLNINQNQFDALVSITFNIGTGAFADSTLLKRVKANPNDYAGITDAFKMWVKVGSSTSQGLVNRRTKEAALYCS